MNANCDQIETETHLLSSLVRGCDEHLLRPTLNPSSDAIKFNDFGMMVVVVVVVVNATASFPHFSLLFDLTSIFACDFIIIFGLYAEFHWAIVPICMTKIKSFPKRNTFHK